VAMMRRSSVQKRLERLEEIRQKRADTLCREAFVEICCEDCSGERHVVMTCTDGGRCWFQERPGPGPQIADFGVFHPVVYLTPAEMDS
jgi:hypothetical protein